MQLKNKDGSRVGTTAPRHHVDIIGYDCGWGCADFGCQDGPAGIAADQLIACLEDAGFNTHWTGSLGIKNLSARAADDTKETTLPYLLIALKRLAAAVQDSVAQHHIPLVIGGDHSSAIGTFAGVAAAENTHGKTGLIWIDAHLDCHTYETSWQGKFGGWWHGQPIPALCGDGLPELVAIGGDKPKIDPAHVTIIGASSFEPAEKNFAEKNGIRVFDLATVQARGFDAVFAEAYARATTGTDGFGISIDLDGFSPDDAPGVGTREPAGLDATSVLPVLAGRGRDPLLRAVEIVEYNPAKDNSGKTARLLQNIAASLFKDTTNP